MKTIIESNSSFDQFLKAYSPNELGLEELFTLSNIQNLVELLYAKDTTKKIILEAYDILGKYQTRSNYLLHRIPITNDKKIDLRSVEGSGFYENIDGLWLYHKGGGSVEALVIQHKLGLDNLMFPSFGIEYPGNYGAFGKVSLFGVKRLWQLTQEFSVSFSNMIAFIDKNKISDPWQVIGKCCIPISLTKLKAVTNIISSHLSTKSNTINAVYNNIKDSHQVAKIILCVPSNVRATDKRYVRRKWVETKNIFIRSLSQDNTTINMLKENPYWDHIAAFHRGSTLKLFLESGFINEIQSGHLQNFYYVGNTNIQDNYSLGADFCDFHLTSHLTKKNIICILSNLLAGWRIAESSGPSWESTNDISFNTVMNCINAYMEGLLGNQHKDAADLFLLLPESTSLAIAKHIYQIVNKDPVQNNWELISNFLGHKDDIKLELLTLRDSFQNEIQPLYQAVMELRPKTLVNIIFKVLQKQADTVGKKLLTYSRKIQKLNIDPNKTNVLLYLSKQVIELAFKNNQNIHNFLDNLHSQNLISFLYFKQHLSDEAKIYYQNLINYQLFDELLWHLDEIFHSNAHVFGEWIMKYNATKQGFQKIVALINKLQLIISTIFFDPQILLDNYLCFIFKKSDLFSLIQTGNYDNFTSKINKSWEVKEEIPIERKYLILHNKKSELVESLRKISSKDAVENLLQFDNTFYQVYMETHEN